MTALATRHTALATITDKLATRFDLGNNGQELIETLKATAFKGQVTDAQMTALNTLAQEAGFTDIHLQIMTTQQAAAFKFATSATTSLHIVPNQRNPMIWRLVEMK